MGWRQVLASSVLGMMRPLGPTRRPSSSTVPGLRGPADGGFGSTTPSCAAARATSGRPRRPIRACTLRDMCKRRTRAGSGGLLLGQPMAVEVQLCCDAQSPPACLVAHAPAMEDTGANLKEQSSLRKLETASG